MKSRACVLYIKRPSLEHFHEFYAASQQIRMDIQSLFTDCSHISMLLDGGCVCGGEASLHSIISVQGTHSQGRIAETMEDTAF